MSALVDRFFDLSGRGSTPARELRGGFATFLTMSYILVANADILAAAGMPRESVIACTAAAAGICCLLMGLFGNFPVALASGMGLNAVVAFQVAPAAGSWQKAMGLIVLDGVVILVLVLCGLRERMMTAIPRDLRRAIGGGIGLFIAFIGAVQAGLVVVPGSTLAGLTQHPGAILPPVGFGSLAHPPTAVALFGLLVTALLLARNVRGAIVLGILISTGAAWAGGLTRLPDRFAPPSFAAAFQADVVGALDFKLLPLLLSIVLVDFFDTLGTVTALAEEGNLLDPAGQVPELRNVLLVDSAAAGIGGMLGASSVTCYIESAAGVAEGARTGLHSVVVGVLFLAAVFLAPVAAMVPPCATAPALILVGFLMAGPITRIDFEDLGTSIPAFVTLVMLPFTWSITHGIGTGFITYVFVKTLSGRYREVHPLMYVAAAAFAAHFVYGG